MSLPWGSSGSTLAPIPSASNSTHTRAVTYSVFTSWKATLTVCYYSATFLREYPKEFRTAPGSRTVLYRFQRDKGTSPAVDAK